MNAQFIQDKPVDYIDNILLKDGELQVIPAAEMKKIPHDDLRLWCYKNAIYGVPTTELIDLIKSYMVLGKTIEVGAGCGVFGRALNIPSTDSFIQSQPDMKALYLAMKQPVVEYGKNVERLEASDAIKKYKPDVVFGSWVTQFVSPHAIKVPPGGGSVAGLKEDEFIKLIKKYIIYGNENIHGFKEIFNNAKLHIERIFNTELFFSRASDHGLNCLYIVTHVGN
jgi:hypothetical protein